MRWFWMAIRIIAASGLALPAFAAQQIQLDAYTYARLSNPALDELPPVVTVAFEEGPPVDLTFQPMDVWTTTAQVNLLRDGEVVATLEPPSRQVWVAGAMLPGADGSPEAVSAVMRRNAIGGMSLSVRRGERQLRWRSDAASPRRLLAVRPSDEALPDSTIDKKADGADDSAKAPDDGALDIGQSAQGQTADEGSIADRIRFGHLGAEIAVVVDSDGAQMIFQHGFEGATTEPYTHVEAWVTDLFAHLNTPFRRDVELSLAISSLDVHLGQGEPWDTWIPDMNRSLPNLKQYTVDDRRDVGVAWLALQNHWVNHRSRVHRDAVLLLYGPPAPGDGGGISGDIGKICDPSQAYAVVKLSPSLLGFPALPVGVPSSVSSFQATYFNTAHELGHVFGGRHTHPDFDRCDDERFTSVQVSTIMSYCKQRKDEFREENRLRMRDVVERAACLDMLPYPTLETLTAGTPVTGISADKGFSRRFSMTVPPGTKALELRTSGGTGNVMMYAMYENREVGRSAAPGTRQQIVVSDPGYNQTWEIWLQGNADFQNVTLEAHTVEQLANGYARFGLAKQRTNGVSLSNYNSIIYALQIPVGTTRLIVESHADDIVGGGCGSWGDADLYLGFGDLSSPVYSVTPGCHEERIEIRDPQQGLWYLAVHARSDFQHATVRAAWDLELENGATGRRNQMYSPSRPIQTGDAFLYRIDLPPDVTALSFDAQVTSTANAQSASLADVYARAGEVPTANAFDGVTTAWTHLGVANALVTAPAPGRWYLEVRPGGQFIATSSLTVNHDGGSGLLHDRVPFGPVCEDRQSPAHVYQLDVAQGADAVRFTLAGGTGEADLYVVHGVRPDFQQIADPGNPAYAWDAVSATAGTDETITVPAPAAGSWYVLASPDNAFCGVTLTAATSIAPQWAPAPNTLVHLYVPSNGLAGDIFPMAASAADADGDPLTYTWDFGDGATFTETLPAGASEVDHSYSSAGNYVVTVTVDDGSGASALTDQRTAMVAAAPPQPPVITQTDIPATASLNQPVQLRVSATDPAGLPLTYAWRLVDEYGALEQAQGASVSHVFRSAGKWYVTVVAENSAGVQSSAQASVQVQ